MSENVRRGNTLYQKIHCKHGHLLIGDNLKLVSGKRVCRACANANNRAYKARRKREFGDLPWDTDSWL